MTKKKKQVAEASTPQNTGEAWTTVLGRKAKKLAKGPPKVKAPPRPKLRAPSSSAVTLTLPLESMAKGTTYASVLAEARKRIDLKELGIDALRFRTAVTGARILEVPGEASAQKADALAAKLQEVLGPESAKVQRPTRRADLRIVGLDDSITPEEVTEALAKEGECSATDIKTGALTSHGTLFVSCPIPAAKKVAQEGRLRVGWIMARAMLLAPKPMRCFRCLALGHVGAKCTAEDRSLACFRCGAAGHKARECLAEPKCAICAAADRPASHSIGDTVCPESGKTSKRNRGRGGRTKRKNNSALRRSEAPTRPAEGTMDTSN